MAPQFYSASAPGSIMLMGEHAVLARKNAIVCAINKRIHVKLIPNVTQKITIKDPKLGELLFDRKDLKILAPFEFVLSAIKLFESQINTGFDIEIIPEFSSVLGFGSSAAVTVATVAVLSQWLNGKQLAARQLFKLAKHAVLQVQGLGSGADIAASVFGGVLGYKTFPLQFIPLPIIPNLTAVYCGYKKPTKVVVAEVNAARQKNPKFFTKLYAAMQECVQQAMQAIRVADWQSLGVLFTQHQGLQYAMGVSDAMLDTLVRQLCQQPGVWGAKISGSGLGDCVIGLGALPDNVFPCDNMQQQQGVMQFVLAVEPKGLKYE